MKKMLLLLFIALSCGIYANNLLQNNPLQDWEEYSIIGNEVQKKTIFSKNNKVVELKHIQGGRIFGITTFVKAENGKSYKFSAETKSLKGGKAVLAVKFLDKTNKLIAEEFSQIHTNLDWEKIDFYFMPIPKTAKIQILLLNYEQSSVFFKNPTLEIANSKFVKKTIPFDFKIHPASWSDIWNKTKTFHSFLDAPTTLSFHFKGVKSQMVKPQFVIEYPSELKLVDAFASHTNFYRKEKSELMPIKRNGKDYTRAIFSNLKALQTILVGYGWERKLGVAFMPKSDKIQAGHVGKVYAYCVNNEIKGREENFDFVLLKPLPNRKMPKDFRFLRWDTYDSRYSDDEIFLKAVKMFERAGVTTFERHSDTFKRGKELDDILDKRDWKRYASISWSLGLKFFPKKYLANIKIPLEYTMKFDGKIDKNKLCPTFYLDENSVVDQVRKHAFDTLKSQNPKSGDLILLNIEPWETLNWCFCKRCRTKFAKQFNLKNIPSATEIRKSYVEEWVIFRTENTANQVKMFADIIRGYNSKLVVTMYDYVVDFNNKDFRKSYRNFSIDPELLDKYIDIHVASYYHYYDKKAFDMMKLNANRLKKAYLPLGALDGIGYLSRQEILNPKQQRLMILAAAVNGSCSFGFYSGQNIDAMFLTKISDAMAEVAVLEDFFKKGRMQSNKVAIKNLPYRERKFRGRTISFPDWSPVVANSAIENNGEILISILNYSKSDKVFTKISPKLQSGKYTVINPITNRRLVNNPNQIFWTNQDLQSKLIVDTNALDATFWIIREFKDSDKKLKATLINQDTFKKDQAMYLAKSSFQTKQSGAFKIDMPSSGLIEISNATQRIDIALSDGGVKSWKLFDKEPFIGKFCEDRLWFPQNITGAITTKTKIINAKVTNSYASLTLERSLSPLEAKLLKTYKIDKNKNKIFVELKVVNFGNKNIEIGLWIHNFIKNANKLTKIANYNNKEQIVPHSQVAPVYINANVKNYSGFLSKSIYGKITNGKSFVNIGKSKFEADIPFNDLLLYYYYMPVTLEWLFKTSDIAPKSSKSLNFVLSITE